MALILQAVMSLHKPVMEPGHSSTCVDHSIYRDDVFILVIVALYVKHKKCACDIFGCLDQEFLISAKPKIHHLGKFAPRENDPLYGRFVEQT